MKRLCSHRRQHTSCCIGEQCRCAGGTMVKPLLLLSHAQPVPRGERAAKVVRTSRCHLLARHGLCRTRSCYEIEWSSDVRFQSSLLQMLGFSSWQVQMLGFIFELRKLVQMLGFSSGLVQMLGFIFELRKLVQMLGFIFELRKLVQIKTFFSK